MKKFENVLIFVDLSRGDWAHAQESSELENMLLVLAAACGASSYAVDVQRGRAAIITPEAEAAGVDIALDLAGYTVAAI